jgi:small conductance mechanosensitive channel
MFLTLLAVTVLTLLAVMDVPIGPLLAASSIIGIAVGFGAQSLVKDIIAGYFILSENQYTLGDVVRIAGVAGAVTDIRARVTVLRDLEGNVHYVPNGLIEVTSNLTQEFAQVVVDVGIAYGEDVDRAIEVVGDEIARFAADEEWLPRFLDEPQLLGVNALGSWSVDLRVLFKVPPDDRWLVKREFLRRIKNRLDAEGIEIPFPYTTLVPGDPERWRSILSPAESGDG